MRGSEIFPTSWWSAEVGIPVAQGFSILRRPTLCSQFGDDVLINSLALGFGGIEYAVLPKQTCAKITVTVTNRTRCPTDFYCLEFTI